VTIRIYCKM